MKRCIMNFFGYHYVYKNQKDPMCTDKVWKKKGMEL